MAWTEYMSTDASAPVLDGNAGSLITVLRAILVNGYGAKAAAGWAEPFAASGNIAMFRPPSGALRPFVRVDDSAARAAPFNNGCEARIRLSEGATALSTQTGIIPTTVQVTNGIIVRKSSNAASSPWIAYADARTCYLFIQSGDYGAGWGATMFGEYFSIKPTSDTFNGIIIGKNTEQVAATPTVLPNNEFLPLLAAVGTALGGHYLARSFTEVAQQAVNVGKHGAGQHSAATLVGLMMWPNSDGATYLEQVKVHEIIVPLCAYRGRLRGFWQVLHPAVTFNHLDTFSGAGTFAGKTFRIIKPTPDGLGIYCMETSATLETN